jgi:UDP-glucose 4-epimerase
MKALVTGGAGFIGSHLVNGLLAKGVEVVVLDDLSTGLLENVPQGVEFVLGSVGDAEKVNQVTEGVDVIFHLAAVSSVQDSLARPLDVHYCNLTSTLLLLEAARKNGAKRFVFSSSAAVYGDTGGLPAREDMTPMPLSHYAVQKLACEHYASAYHRLYGLETICLRYFNIFGPRQRGDSPYSGVIAKFIAASKHAKPMVIYGDGLQSRDFCPVANVVAANIGASTAPSERVAGKVFNVGTGTSTSIAEIAELIRKATLNSLPIEKTAGKSGEIGFSKACINLARDAFDYRPDTDLQSGLHELVVSEVGTNR